VGQAHALFAQILLFWQAVSQVPQCALSLVKSAQVPSQSVDPFGQVHSPAPQIWVALHAILQSPQCAASLSKSTH
jgi:hypothetical protein